MITRFNMVFITFFSEKTFLFINVYFCGCVNVYYKLEQNGNQIFFIINFGSIFAWRFQYVESRF